MKSEAESERRVLVRNGVGIYGRALAAAGGREQESLMRSCARAGVCTAIYAAPPYDLRVPSLPVSRLTVNLTSARVFGGVDGDRMRSFDAARYSIFFVPAGMPVSWRKDSPSRHISIYFHRAALDGIGDEALRFENQEAVFNVQVAGVRLLADQLVEELGNPSVFGAEAADSLARLVLVRLARRFCDPSATLGSLAPRVLASLRDYVVTHLAERILIVDLARHAGLSPSRLALAFGEHMRQTPHQFVLALRLDHAAHLLRATDLSLVEVAHACGFANQQHLSNTMRRMRGTTPSRYRRAHGP